MEHLREYFRLDSAAILGHSWGGLLAMEYATRHPERVSHLILMNTAPASHDGWMLLWQELPKQRAPGDVDKMKAISSSAKYQEGNHETDAEYYRIHFSPTMRQPEQLERVVKSLRLNVTKEGIVKAREIAEQLYKDTFLSNDYDLLPKLSRLSIPTLMIHGDYDFIPVECVAPFVQALPGSHFVMLKECGHFSYIERPDEVRKVISDFIHGT